MNDEIKSTDTHYDRAHIFAERNALEQARVHALLAIADELKQLNNFAQTALEARYY